MKQLIEGYPEGSDITLMNVIYSYPTKQPDGSWLDDFIILIYKDNVTGKKNHQIIYKPDYTFYITKDGVPVPDHPLFFIEKDKVQAVTVPYRDLEKKIAELTGNTDFYKQNVADKNRYENRKLHLQPNVFFSDTSIEDHYRFLFNKQYTNSIGKLHKAFYDIECDTRYMAGDFVESGECPINMVSLHDEEYDITISFILRDHRNPLIEEFENEVGSGAFTEADIKKFVEENVGGWKQAKRLKLDQTHYKLLFFDDELELIANFFQTVHQLDPDFIEGWNSSAFDLQYFIDRIFVLGGVPAEIMTNPNYEVRMVKNIIDTRNQNDLAERGDYAIISGNPVWLDQMIQFASRRKAKIGSFTSFKLDDIGQDTAKVRKLSYAHITKDISLLPYLDFKTFVLYNIMDVVVQKCIEVKSQDLEYIFSMCITNNTSYRKGYRQTVYLINRMAKEFDEMGFVIGNNQNKSNPAPEEKFTGALVGDPLKTDDFSKIKIDGRAIMVTANCDDFDYKSLYPSIIGEFNIAPNSQIGRIEIADKVYDNENVYGNEKYARGGEFVENMTVDNIIEFCHRWLHLAGIKEFLEDMQEYESQFIYGAPYNRFKVVNNRCVESPIYDYDKPICPIQNQPIKPVYFCSDLKDNGLSNDFETIKRGDKFDS